MKLPFFPWATNAKLFSFSACQYVHSFFSSSPVNSTGVDAPLGSAMPRPLSDRYDASRVSPSTYFRMRSSRTAGPYPH
eukprot:4565465-Pyramimonas_sp.AAC.1